MTGAVIRYEADQTDPHDEDCEAALAEVERLWGAESGTPEGDRLDVLATLIDADESAQYPMDPPDPIEATKFRMEQQGSTRKDPEPLIGTRTRAAEVLNRHTRPVDRFSRRGWRGDLQAGSST